MNKKCSARLAWIQSPHDGICLHVAPGADKFYVGKSDDVYARYAAHLAGQGAAWTRLHPPMELFEVHACENAWDEESTTKQLMFIYGIGNVRGGAHITVELAPGEEQAIYRDICSANDLCFRCGQSGHFASECAQAPDTPLPITTTTPVARGQIGRGCYRCGRTSHFVRNCYAKTHVSGAVLGRRSRHAVTDVSENGEVVQNDCAMDVDQEEGAANYSTAAGQCVLS